MSEEDRTLERIARGDYLYLAHPFDSRYDTRDWELEFEKKSGIELKNPFYDIEREDIVTVDEGRRSRYQKLDSKEIVNRDVNFIRKSKGVVAIINGDLSYGTIQEMVYSHIYSKPLFSLITNGHKNHPWLRYHSSEIFTDRGELEEYLEKLKLTGFQVPVRRLESKEDFKVKQSIEKIINSDKFCVTIDGSPDYDSIQGMVYAHGYGKEVNLLVTNGHEDHPWLNYHATKIFTDKDLFEKEVGNGKH